MMRSIIYNWEDEDDGEKSFVDIALETVTIMGSFSSAEPTGSMWWSDGGGGGNVQPPRPRNYWQQECFSNVCPEGHRLRGSL